MENVAVKPVADREIQLAGVIQKILEKNTQIDNLKAIIEQKTLQQLRAGCDQHKQPKRKRPSPDDHSPGAVIYAVNELIMEYFHWFRYQYSIEMFTTETGCDPNSPGRSYMEEKLGPHDKDVPILVAEVLRLLQSNNQQQQ